MIKMTIATDKKGKLVGAIQQRAEAEAEGAPSTSVAFGRGHKLHTLEVPAELDMAKAKDGAAFQKALQRHIAKAS